MSEEAQEELIRSYVSMRKMGANKNVVTATPRQLESLIRMSESLAKMEYSPVVYANHVIEAVSLIDIAMKKAAMDPITGI